MLETTEIRSKLQRAEAVTLKASQELLQVKQQVQQQASAGGNSSSSAGNSSASAAANRRPARALRRVEDGDGGSWLLFEFEGGGGGVREWRRFSDEVMKSSSSVQDHSKTDLFLRVIFKVPRASTASI